MKDAIKALIAIVIILTIIAIPVAIYGGGAYILIHFIRKFW